MGTHRAVFGEARRGGREQHEQRSTRAWSLGAGRSACCSPRRRFVGWLSEILVGSTEAAIKQDRSVGDVRRIIIVPIIGNAAEHSSAVLMAMRNRMDLAVSIAIGSSAQVALLIAPVLVFVGLAFGQPMDLAFNIFEVVAVALAVAVATSVVRDAESHWLEGAFLLLVYGMLGVAFFYF